jgi:hypothetical protein
VVGGYFVHPLVESSALVELKTIKAFLDAQCRGCVNDVKATDLHRCVPRKFANPQLEAENPLKFA